MPVNAIPYFLFQNLLIASFLLRSERDIGGHSFATHLAGSSSSYYLYPRR